MLITELKVQPVPLHPGWLLKCSACRRGTGWLSLGTEGLFLCVSRTKQSADHPCRPKTCGSDRDKVSKAKGRNSVSRSARRCGRLRGCGAGADAGRGWSCPRAGSASRLLPLTRKEREGMVRLSCPLCETRAAPAGKGETLPAGAAGRGRVLLHCCPAGEGEEEASAKRGHGHAVF